MNKELQLIKENTLKLYEILQKMEKQGIESNEKYDEWLEKISLPNYKLFHYILELTCDDSIDQATKENLYYIIRKLLFLKWKNVSSQILDNNNFHISLAKFFTSANLIVLTNNPIILLSFLLKKGKLRYLINEKLLNSFFNGLRLIEDSETLIALCHLMTDINASYKPSQENLFLKVHKENPNAYLLDEILLRLLVVEEHEKEDESTILICLIKIMTYENSPIFSENDQESFIDIIIDKLQSTESNETKEVLLKSFEKITQYDLYYRKLYKINELTDLLEGYQGNDTPETEAIRNISKQIIMNIIQHQAKKKY